MEIFTRKRIILIVVLVVAVIGIAALTKNRSSQSPTASITNTFHTTPQNTIKQDELAAVLPYYQDKFSIIYREDYTTNERIVLPILVTAPGADAAELEADYQAMVAYFNQHGIDTSRYVIEYSSNYLADKYAKYPDTHED